MALSLPADVPQRALLQEITFGVVLFTLLVQGTTVGWVVDRTIGTTGTGATPTGEGPTGEVPA
jgi:CPA1 family monovalent cation:H+ antiporter